jgi:hypothetical protein
MWYHGMLVSAFTSRASSSENPFFSSSAAPAGYHARILEDHAASSSRQDSAPDARCSGKRSTAATFREGIHKGTMERGGNSSDGRSLHLCAIPQSMGFQKRWIVAAFIQVEPRQRGGLRCLGAADHCCVDTLDALDERLSVVCLHSIAHVKITKLKNFRGQFRSWGPPPAHNTGSTGSGPFSAHDAGRLRVERSMSIDAAGYHVLCVRARTDVVHGYAPAPHDISLHSPQIIWSLLVLFGPRYVCRC